MLLLQFSPNQPSPVGCSAYTIPANQEGPWAAIASAGGTLLAEEPARNLWEKFASIHGQVRGSEWPDVVHGLELPSSRGMYEVHKTMLAQRLVRQRNPGIKFTAPTTFVIQYIYEHWLAPTALSPRTVKHRLSRLFKRVIWRRFVSTVLLALVRLIAQFIGLCRFRRRDGDKSIRTWMTSGWTMMWSCNPLHTSIGIALSTFFSLLPSAILAKKSHYGIFLCFFQLHEVNYNRSQYFFNWLFLPPMNNLIFVFSSFSVHRPIIPTPLSQDGAYVLLFLETRMEVLLSFFFSGSPDPFHIAFQHILHPRIN